MFKSRRFQWKINIPKIKMNRLAARRRARPEEQPSYVESLRQKCRFLEAELTDSKKDLRDARQSVVYYREQCEQLRSENESLRRHSSIPARGRPRP